MILDKAPYLPAAGWVQLNRKIEEKETMFTVYVLYSERFNRTYTGLTNNLDRRLKEHNSKQNKSTKAYTPWRLIYTEQLETRVEAREREKFLKSGKGRDFIKTVIKAP